MPAGQLYINGQDAYATWGVSLEDTAIAALMAPPPMKPGIVNESRLEHGKRYINLDPKVDERDITLPIHLVARNRTEYLSRYRAFLDELRGGDIAIQTSHEQGVVYHCIYQSCTQFSQFLDGLAKFSLRLTEPNPDSRT